MIFKKLSNGDYQGHDNQIISKANIDDMIDKELPGGIHTYLDDSGNVWCEFKMIGIDL